LALTASVDHHLLTTNFTPQGLAVNLIWPAGHVPRVLDEHVRTLSTVYKKMGIKSGT